MGDNGLQPHLHSNVLHASTNMLIGRQYWKRVVGCVLLIGGVILLSAWCFWLLPIAKKADPRTENYYSRNAYWIYFQNHINRFGWSHEDGHTVGLFGDKKWVERIIGGIKDNQSDLSCSAGHKDAALELITGQRPHSIGEIPSAEDWLLWWQKNKDKTQVQWIQEGLSQFGVSIHIPPSPGEQEQLLRILVTGNDPESDPPWHVRYNAFRVLRGCEFDAIDFALTNATVGISEELKNGLRKYNLMYRSWPKEDFVGWLPIDGQQADLSQSAPDYFLYNPIVRGVIYCGMVTLIFGGFALLRSSFHNHGNVEPSSPTNASSASLSQHR